MIKQSFTKKFGFLTRNYGKNDLQCSPMRLTTVTLKAIYGVLDKINDRDHFARNVINIYRLDLGKEC